MMFLKALSVLYVITIFGEDVVYQYYENQNPTLQDLQQTEKNIFLLWWQAEKLKSNVYLDACFETILKNKGEFRPVIITKENWKKYFETNDLPPDELDILEPAAMKDVLLDLLLANHGGVIMDFTTILFENLDKVWNAMIAKEATARFYIYDPPSWGDQFTAVWFIMAKKGSKPTMAYKDTIMSKNYNLAEYKKYLEKKPSWDRRYLMFGTGIYNPILRNILKMSRNLGSSSSSSALYPPNFVRNGVWFVRVNDLPISDGPGHLADSFTARRDEICKKMYDEEMILFKMFGGSGSHNPLKNLTKDRLNKNTDEIFSVYYNSALDESFKEEKCKDAKKQRI